MHKNPLDDHVVLTTHPHTIYEESPEIHWGAPTPEERGPVVGSLNDYTKRNVIGTHSGSYGVYGALSQALGHLKKDHRPDLTNTQPIVDLPEQPSWHDPEKIVSIDPWGGDVGKYFKKHLDKGYDIRPSIAITKAHINMPEITDHLKAKEIVPDGKILKDTGEIVTVKAAIEPVWYLPGMAKRFGISEGELRRSLFKDTGGMFPELVTRPEIKILLPPIGGCTVYIFGDPENISDEKKELTVRVHDECNGSDVFGSDICTCRPYLVHGIEECLKTAQNGGTGVIIYFRKEGRALGEVTKFLVYNARKRQAGGDTASNYFKRTECVAGVEDMRFQQLMPDPLHWLGIKKIDNLISMSNMKYDAIVGSGIKVLNRYSIPDDLIPDDAYVEIEAKKAAGYFSEEDMADPGKLDKVKGRDFDDK